MNRVFGVFLGSAFTMAAFALTSAPGGAVQQTAASPQIGGRGRGAPPVTTMAPVVPPATGTGALNGVVIDAATRRPVAEALVFLGGGPAGGPRPRQVTDGAGRFLFTNLPAGSDFWLSATHPDYLRGEHNAGPGEPGARVRLLDGQFATANIALYRPGSLSGTVVDERGEPAVGVPVRILKAVEIAGQTGRALGPVTETDDRGMYRVTDLTPGTYFVHVPNVQITIADGAIRPPIAPQRPLAMARASGGVAAIVGHYATPPSPGRAYAMAYHPAARSVTEATPIAVEHGEARTNVDVQLSLVPTVRVSGTLGGMADAVASMPVWLVPAGDEHSGVGGEVAITISSAAGAFTFLDVPAGRYTLIASRSQSEYWLGGRGESRLLPERGSAFDISMIGGEVAGLPNTYYSTRARSGAAAYGRLSIDVEGRDVANLVVPLAPGVRVSGHFLWDGQPTAPASLQAVPRIGLESADGDLALGFPQTLFLGPSGGAHPSPIPFTIDGVLPGRYLIGLLLVPGGFVVEGAEWRGRDLLTTPLEVTGDASIGGVVVHLTNRTTTVSGTVRDANGAPATRGSVIMFPASSSSWETIGFRARRFASAAIGEGGSYTHTGLPPGDYLVAAIQPADRSRWLHRDFLSALSAGATRVRLESGGVIAQDLRLPAGRR